MKLRPQTVGLALFELLQPQGEAVVTENMESLEGFLELYRENKTLSFLLNHPALSEASKEKLLQIVTKALPMAPATLNLLRLLLREKHMKALPAVMERLRRARREAFGVVEANLVTAEPLDEAMREQIAKKAAAAFGAKRVEWQTSADPKLLGGAVVEWEGFRLDGSLKHQLSVIKKTLTPNS